MDFTAGGIDLALDDGDQPFVNIEGEGVPIVEPAQPSLDNTMLYADIGVGTGQTLSSDDFGREDEVTLLNLRHYLCFLLINFDCFGKLLGV